MNQVRIFENSMPCLSKVFTLGNLSEQELWPVSVNNVFNVLSVDLAHDDEVASVVGVDESLSGLRCPAEAVQAAEPVLPVLFQFLDRRQTSTARTLCKLS